MCIYVCMHVYIYIYIRKARQKWNYCNYTCLLWINAYLFLFTCLVISSLLEERNDKSNGGKPSRQTKKIQLDNRKDKGTDWSARRSQNRFLLNKYRRSWSDRELYNYHTVSTLAPKKKKDRKEGN